MPADPKLPTLFLIGDSTVRNGRGDGANGQWGWGEPLVDRFDTARINVVNRAVGGLSSRTYLTQGHWQRVMAMLKPGDVVMMQFGHNDGGPLDDAARARIIALHTGRIAKAYGVEVEAVDAAFINEALRRWSTLAGYGTREIIRWIEEAVADEMIAAKSRGAGKVKLAWSDGRARVEAA
jgi:lysophospholipase L1-like esterase